jgi:hypothetical protein
MPAGRKTMYLCLVISDRPQKAQPHCVRFTIGSDRIDYPGEVSTKMASLATAKLLFNSVITTSGAEFMTMDINDFYLCTPMDHFEYMWIKVADIPKDIFDHYNLAPSFTMATSTPRSDVACTASRKLAALPTMLLALLISPCQVMSPKPSSASRILLPLMPSTRPTP